ncbi:hypothetical protein EsH8_III_001085 [Colletotrichum jinshuiense]
MASASRCYRSPPVARQRSLNPWRYRRGRDRKYQPRVTCDGVRPHCYACTTAKTACVYPVPEGLSQRQAQKQKLSHVSRAHESSRKVLELLRASRDSASTDILQQLQHSEHLDEAIQTIADASLLLPKIHDQRNSRAEGVEHEVFSSQPQDPDREPTTRPVTGSSDNSTRDIPTGISDSSRVLPVSRWTTVLKDDKLLTHLVGLFWTWDENLSHLIDRELFVADLSSAGSHLSQDQPRGFCSPLLVNAILAVSALHTTRKHPGSFSGDIITLGHRFASHAFDLLELEKNVSSLTLLQGAAILWVFASNEGSRAPRGQCASLKDLIKRTWSALGLETDGSGIFGFSGKDTAHDVRIWQAVSHITWGFYCFFAEMSLLFSPETLVSRPLIMKTFENQDAQLSSGSQASTSSTGDDALAAQTSYKMQIFSAKCSLCEIIDQFLSRATYDFVALKLLFTYTSYAGTSLFDGRNAASLQILHAGSMMTNLWIYRGIYTIKHEYWAAEYCSFVAHALLPRLEADSSTPAMQDIISKACCVLNEMTRAGVSDRSRELLLGIEARARVLRVRVPPYGRRLAADGPPESAPVFMVRGVQVFDGAGGGMLGAAGGTHSVRFANTISDIEPMRAEGWGGTLGENAFAHRPPR